jgi:hypothetical protein
MHAVALIVATDRKPECRHKRLKTEPFERRKGEGMLLLLPSLSA